MKQLLLNAKGCSGRGVRIAPLASSVRDEVFEQAAKDVGPEGTMLALRRREERTGLCAFVVEVTEKDGYTDAKQIVGAAWKKVTAEHLDEKLDAYFNTKDVAALITIFRRLHDVTPKEIEDILGEALDVTSA